MATFNPQGNAFNPNNRLARYDQVSAARAINANSHPSARVAFTALDNVYNVRRQKGQAMPGKSQMQVNRPHSFSHPPFGLSFKPAV